MAEQIESLRAILLSLVTAVASSLAVGRQIADQLDATGRGPAKESESAIAPTTREEADVLGGAAAPEPFDFTVVQPLINILKMLSEHTKKEKVDVKEAFLRQGGAELLKKIQDTPTQDDSEIPLRIVTEIMFQMLMTYTVDDSAKLEKEIEDIYTDLIPLMTFSSFDHSTVKNLETIWNKLNAVLSVEKRLLAKVAFLRAGGPELFKEMQKCLQSDAVENGLLEVMMDIYTLMMDFTFTSLQAHHENEDTFPEPEEIKAQKRRHVFKDILRRLPRPSRRRHRGAPSRTGTDGVIGGTHTQSE
ncbi:uncharacterized protein LOC144948151 [Lampetra fluviatilis]